MDKEKLDHLLYADRDPIALDEAGNYYCRHVMAMTGEGLHEKADIAAELAFRDMKNDELERRITQLEADKAELLNKLIHIRGYILVGNWPVLFDKRKEFKELSDLIDKHSPKE